MRIIGNGGHAKAVRDVIYALGLEGARGQEGYAFVAIGDNKIRRKVVEQELPDEGSRYVFPALVHPSAIVSRSAKIGDGTVVMAGAIIQADAVIGKHCIINTGATVDHDCVVGDYAHIAPGAHLCGGVEVGDGALVGVGSCAVPMAKISEWSLLKAGEVAKAR